MAGRELTSLGEVEAVLRSCRVVAVLGCHPEASRPAHYVPAYLRGIGKKILPVNPRFVGQRIFDETVVAKLNELQEPIDVVDVFRRSEDVPAHLDEIKAMTPLPKVVWLQSGISHDETAAELMKLGIDVVQDRCMLADGRRLGL